MMKRREFIKTGALATAAATLNLKAKTTDDKTPCFNPGSVTFCAFADIHYVPGAFPHDSVEWLDQILDRATRERVDFIIHAGDFTHRPKKETAYIDHYNDFKIKTYNCLGNHDNDGNHYKDSLDAYRMKSGYYHFDSHGFRFIVLDPNYFKDDKTFVHYSAANYYGKPSLEWIPPEQLEWLKYIVNSSPFPCVTISHQSFERQVGAIKNFRDVRKILNDANRKTPGKVRLCINGHHHRDFVRILDGIVYLDLNSANYDWLGKPHDKYPKAIMDKWPVAKHTIFWNDPISAIITMTQDGQLTIKGQESTFYMGIDSIKSGNRYADGCGRPATPVIQSFSVNMNYA